MRAKKNAASLRATPCRTIALADRDTGEAALRRYHELLRAQTPAQRAAQMESLTRMVRKLAIAGIQERHPGASDDEIRVRFTVRLYGRAVAGRLFGAVPEDAV